MQIERLHTKIARITILTLGAVSFVLPFLWMVATSLTTKKELFAYPPRFIPDPIDASAYSRLLFEEPLGRWLANSLIVTLSVTVLQVLTSALAAYVFARIQFRGRDVIFVLYLATMMIPFQVLVVPLFIQFTNFGLINTYPALILPDIASPFAVFLLRQAFLQLPRDIEEAAFVDGAGHLRVLSRIVVPMSTAALATVAVLCFMGTWNSFLWPLVATNTPSMMTLPVGLSNLTGRYVTDWNVLLAGATISVIPIMAVYIFAQKYVLQGVAMSGLKG